MTAELTQWLDRLAMFLPVAATDKIPNIQKILQRLDLQNPDAFVITVAGTNGKGSTCTTIAAILEAMGLKVGLFTSPHIHRYNERIKINSLEVNDVDILSAFKLIELNRDSIPLAYFDFSTISAFYLFKQAKVDVIVLEVGLGGRFDATNSIDTNLAVITTIGLDHTDILGDTRAAIAIEKAGILRENVDVVCTEQNPPSTLLEIISNKHCNLWQLNHAYHYEIIENYENGKNKNKNIKNIGDLGNIENFENLPNYEKKWQFHYEHAGELQTFILDCPRLIGKHQFDNCASSIMAILRTPFAHKLTEKVINQGIANVHLQGRFECHEIKNNIWVFDVTHNEEGAETLAKNLEVLKHENPKIPINAVLGMLKNKNALASISPLQKMIEEWLLIGLEGSRGQSAAELAEKLAPLKLNFQLFPATVDACQYLQQQSQPKIILVFGSFHTVAEGLSWLKEADS